MIIVAYTPIENMPFHELRAYFGQVQAALFSTRAAILELSEDNPDFEFLSVKYTALTELVGKLEAELLQRTIAN